MASTRFFPSAALALLLASGMVHAAETVVGFIYVGPRDDYGYNQAHTQGAAAVAKLPDVPAGKEIRQTDYGLERLDYLVEGVIGSTR